MSSLPEPHAPLLRDVSQYEVDFVIPRVGVDLPLGIDPFLLFKSRDPLYANLHTVILDTFNAGIEALRKNRQAEARILLDFPEVDEIGLGNTKRGKKGTGVGTYLTELIIETLVDSPALMERGVRHIEEMQLVSNGIGPDRISDISANVIKSFLIEYTQQQCQLWNIPLVSGAPLPHVLDSASFGWHDGYFDLPLNPVDGTPILLVPRRLVRTLPWINYEDFFRHEFAAYLRAKKVKGTLSRPKLQQVDKIEQNKTDVVAITRNEIHRIDNYIAIKESTASSAQPSLKYLEEDVLTPEAEQLKKRLAEIPSGSSAAADYQRTVLSILNYLFNPQLIDGRMEEKTIDGTERRDIIFTNDSDESFWDYVRNQHSALFIMFEVKNTDDLDNFHLNQTATYLGDRLGRLGFIVTRMPAKDAQIRKAISIFNNETPRKVILFLSNEDLTKMIDIKCRSNNPMRYVQNLYRAFHTAAQ